VFITTFTKNEGFQNIGITFS